MKPGLVERMILSGFMKAEEANNPLVIVCRMLAFPVVIFCIRTKFHPNIVTGISLVLGCSGAIFYFLDAKLAFVVVWSASVVLDYADGIIARKSGKESHFGYLFDMLGDRLKLISLVIAWSFVEGSPFAYILGTTAILILLATEVVSHLFVRQMLGNSKGKAIDENMFYQVFLHFHMHSFLIYGMALYAGGVVALAANVWLALIMLLDLKRELLTRVYCDGRISVQVNDNLLSKFTAFRSVGKRR